MHTTRRTIILTVVGLLAVLTTATPVRAADGVLVTFTSGTGEAPGKITVTNASTGSTATVGLLPKLPATACAEILSTTGQKLGLKTELSGSTVKVFSRNAVIKVEGAAITKGDL
jgi:hypothetical protein